MTERNNEQQLALAYLEGFPGDTRVADVYDVDDEASSALTSLIPHFEYPNYSYLTMAQVLARLPAAEVSSGLELT
jgi:hypothetical protein